MPSRLGCLLAATVCAALITALVGCGRSEEEKARDAVEQFVQAREDGDYEKVCELFDHTFRRAQGLLSNCAQALEAQAAGLPPQEATSIVSVRVKGGKASAELDVSREGEAPSRQTVTLVRRDGDWKIASTT